MTSIFTPGAVVTPKSQDEELIRADEREVNAQVSRDLAEAARIRRSDAETGDIRARTLLKIVLAVFIAICIGVMFGLEWWALCRYFFSLEQAKKEIPEAVMITLLTAGSSVLTLMGFILKGLFSSKD